MRPAPLLWRMIRYRPGLYALDAVLWALIHAWPLLPGLVARAFFDSLTDHAPIGFSVGTVPLLLLLIASAQIALILGGALADILHRFTMSALLRRNLLAGVLARPGARALREAPGVALSRFRDDAEHAEDSISWTLDVIGQAVFAGAAFAILLSVDARITLLVFVPLVAVVGLAHAAGRRVQLYRKASSQATGRVTGALGEVFGAVQAVQLASAEDRVLAHLRGLSETRRRLMLRDRLQIEVLNSIFANTVNLGTGLILILAAGAMREGRFTVGDLALFVYYLAFVTDFTQFFGEFLAHYQQGAVAFERMLTLLPGRPPRDLVAHHPLHLRGPLPPLAPPAADGIDHLRVLEVSGLTYRYPETRRGVEGIDLRVARGEFVVVTGRVGAGKTTLLRALLGLLPPDAGTVRWNGAPVADPGAFFVPPLTAYTPQVPQLFSATLAENILLGLPPDPAALAAALHAAVLDADLAALPAGLATPVGAHGVRLSGGQIQRVAAARMFVRVPDLLVFDDLSSALDVETEARLWARLAARPAATCLVVSHRRAAFRRATCIVVLAEGRVVDQGPLDALLARCPELQRLWAGDARSPNGHE